MQNVDSSPSHAGAKIIAFNSLFLGAALLAFGLLKLVSPFSDWYAVQVSASGLPAVAHPLGIVAEVLTAVLFLAPWVLPAARARWRTVAWLGASVGLCFIMGVAVYVHLHAGVPADVLPLKIKAPVIPLAMLGVAGLNVALLLRRRRAERLVGA